ncbi:LexA family transcriptional regulator [Thioclava sp. GXIMD2076]|uniref:LexA family transcriptional regulator n=1 Tax=Thioclava sp. GXIMD2076 TaxID=3131931 RepID=UPI0030D2ADF2
MEIDAPMGILPHMNNDDLDAFVRGLKVLIEERNLKAAPLSEASGLGTSAVRDLFRKSASPKVSTAFALSKTLGLTIDQVIQRGLGFAATPSPATITISGKVGAGAHVDLFDEIENGNETDEILAPESLSGENIAAVRVIGDSMEPVYSEGDVLFFTRQTHEGVPVEAINRKCIVATPDGKAWVKHLKYGSEEGKFHLTSINPTGENRHNTDVLWATPVRLHLPAEFVMKQR